MQCNPNTTLIFCSLVLTFDILCIMSLSFEKQKCDVCTDSNLTSYVTMYLLIPYVFFGKHKIVDIILKAFEGDIDTTIDIEKHPSKIQIILEWSFYALLFCFGILKSVFLTVTFSVLNILTFFFFILTNINKSTLVYSLAPEEPLIIK